MRDFQRKLGVGGAVLACVLVSSVAGGSARAQQPAQSAEKSIVLKLHSDDPLTRRGFERFYNTDYDDAIGDFQQALKANPDDPFAVNHLLEAMLVRELNREGGLDTRLYISNDFLHTERLSIDPEERAQIQDLVRRSLALSEGMLKKKPDDADALYARGVAKALYAAYQGLIEKAWFTALRSALDAYHDHQRVLELSPDYSDAKLVVGSYNYVIATLPFYEKTVAFLLTFTGSKTKGIEYMRQAALAGEETSVDAKTTLSLVLYREQQHAEALSLARQLYRAYPRNLHFGLAEADLLRASGMLPDAIAAYRNLLALGQQGAFPRDAPLDRAAYDLGDALRAAGNYAEAAHNFELAADLSEADRPRAARARLAAGQMYDLLHRHAAAVKSYQQVVALAAGSADAQEAQRLMKHPYHIP